MENVNTEIFYKVLMLMFRNMFRYGAGFALAVGIDSDTYGEFTTTAIYIIVPIVVALIIEGWTVLIKRTSVYRAYYAKAAPPDTSMAEVDRMVAKRQPPSLEN